MPALIHHILAAAGTPGKQIGQGYASSNPWSDNYRLFNVSSARTLYDG